MIDNLTWRIRNDLIFYRRIKGEEMLTPHQFYRRVAFGITEKNNIKNPLEDSVKQLINQYLK